MKEKPENLQITPVAAEGLSAKPDTSENLTRYEIWYQDTGTPELWHSRSGAVIDTAAQGDFYHDVLHVVQIVFPLQVSLYYGSWD